MGKIEDGCPVVLPHASLSFPFHSFPLLSFQMSASFVHAPTIETGGSPVDAWLAYYWDAASFTGDETITTVDGDLPIKEAAVVFRNFRPVTGTPGAYFADPVGLVAYRPAMHASMDAAQRHAIVRRNDVVVPLGTPSSWTGGDGTDATRTTCVLQQAARQWVSGGRNTANMSMENVIVLYYSALQSLTFATGTATTEETQRTWLGALAALTRAFDGLCRADPRAMHVTLALVYTHGVNDMLQKALAHLFAALPLDSLTRYEMLATMVRRNLRHGTTFDGLVPGPFVVFLLTPLLSEMLADMATTADVQRRFNTKTSALVDALTAVRTRAAAQAAAAAADPTTWRVVHGGRGIAEVPRFDKAAASLSALCAFADTPLTEAQARLLLDHCSSTDASAATPWSTWGVLPAPPALACRVTTARYAVRPTGRYSRPATDGATYNSRIVPATANAFEVFGYKGVEWSALQFHSPGTYTVHAHDLGLATAAKGDSRGDELVANWRLTAGNTLFPTDEVGYSLAGVRHVPRTGYVTETPLRLDAPFTVVVHADRIELLQVAEDAAAPRSYCTIPRRRPDVPALLAFKNLWLHVGFTAPSPPPAVAAAPRAVPATYGGAKSWATVAAAPAATPTPFARAAAL